MTYKMELLIREAIRRWLCFAEDKPLNETWVGLGTAFEYKPVIDEGLMRWLHNEPPAPRTLGWLLLTPKGERVMRQYIKDKICKDFELTI